MERGLFYLPCGNNVDDMPPSFEGWYNPHQRWNGWYAPLFNKETYDKICAYYSDPKTNTQESIDDLKNLWMQIKINLLIQYLWKVNCMTLVHAVYVGGMRTMNEDLINEQILENIFEEIQENYPNLSEQDKQQLTYKTFEEKAQ